MKEIERKFLIKEFPDLEPLCEAHVEQSYISIDPEIRIRKRNNKNRISYYISIKSDGQLSREETEFPISEEFYNASKIILDKPTIKKEYKTYCLDDVLVLECSHVDKGTENEFFYAEIEFESEEKANAFIPPSFLGEEVTYNSKYKMKNYWRRTRLGVGTIDFDTDTTHKQNKKEIITSDKSKNKR
jgi:CYTH domain-containing protein